MEFTTENLRVVHHVIAVLTELEIDYALGGSWASSLHGSSRFTNDADIAVEPFPGKEASFCSRFGPEYYVSLAAAQEAVARRSSFNVIHLDSGYKVDLFVQKDRAYDAKVMERRCSRTLPDSSEPPVSLVSAEDIVLLKLEWYRIGNEISDRQWGDILEVLKKQAGRLDENYLDHWAGQLGIVDLLIRARQEAQAQLGTSS